MIFFILKNLIHATINLKLYQYNLDNNSVVLVLPCSSYFNNILEAFLHKSTDDEIYTYKFISYKNEYLLHKIKEIEKSNIITYDISKYNNNLLVLQLENIDYSEYTFVFQYTISKYEISNKFNIEINFNNQIINKDLYNDKDSYNDKDLYNDKDIYNDNIKIVKSFEFILPDYYKDTIKYLKERFLLYKKFAKRFIRYFFNNNLGHSFNDIHNQFIKLESEIKDFLQYIKNLDIWINRKFNINKIHTNETKNYILVFFKTFDKSTILKKDFVKFCYKFRKKLSKNKKNRKVKEILELYQRYRIDKIKYKEEKNKISEQVNSKENIKGNKKGNKNHNFEVESGEADYFSEDTDQFYYKEIDYCDDSDDNRNKKKPKVKGKCFKTFMEFKIFYKVSILLIIILGFLYRKKIRNII